MMKETTMSSNPSWTGRVVQAEKNTGSPGHLFVDTSAGGSQPITVRPWPYLLPCPESPGDTDPLCLHQACEGVLDYLYSDIKVFAEQYAVPEEALTRIVVDWVISKLMGVDPSPATFFIPERGNEP
jgi:hypothetical protein